MSEYRRVVVTGIGAVTPLGNNAADTWEGMKKGKNGIGPITLFDTENFKAALAAEVKGFDPKEYLQVNEVLRTDRYAQFAVAAAKQAADESGIDGKVDPDCYAVICGTGIGGIIDQFDDSLTYTFEVYYKNELVHSFRVYHRDIPLNETSYK